MCIFPGPDYLVSANLGFISYMYPLIVSKFHNETHDPKGQENKIYTIVKGRETFWKFSKDARKIIENVYKFFVEEISKQFGLTCKMLERAWDRLRF